MELKMQTIPLDLLGVKVKGRKLTEEQILQIIDKREKGQSVHSIAQEFKINRGTVLWYTCPRYRERVKEIHRQKYAKFKSELGTKAKEVISEKNRERYKKKKQLWENMTAEQKVKAMQAQLQRFSQRMQGVEMFKIRLEEHKNEIKSRL